MGIKNYLKSIIGTVIVVTVLVFGSASATTVQQPQQVTGTIIWATTSGSGYLFMSMLPESGIPKFCYYTGTNSAIATIIDNAKRLNQKVTVVIDNNTNKLLLVR